MAYRNPHDSTGRGEMGHQMPTDEPGSAKDRDVLHGHRRIPSI
jgi:hypothetical protein